MSHARLLAIEVERFKSYRRRQRMEIAPITILLGRNNSGKSTLIQPLLLLKQSLAVPRPELALDLGGPYVMSRRLGDMTHGWPDLKANSPGPAFSIEWHSRVDMRAARERWVNSRPDVVADRARLPWVAEEAPFVDLDVRLELEFTETSGAIGVSRVGFKLLSPSQSATAEFRREADGRYGMKWNGDFAASSIHVTMDHFLPYIDIGRIQLGRNDTRRSYLNAWLSTFAPAIEDLRLLLGDMQYLSSARAIPREQNEPVVAPPVEVGGAGEQAAAMYKARGDDHVHFLPPTGLDGPADERVRERKLKEAVNDVLAGLGVDGQFSVDDGQLFGYRLLFGRASLPHVGRGLTYLLPVIEVGLLADPLRFRGGFGDLSIAEYGEKAGRSMIVALEEAESHLHPKVQSRLAHWLVALARCKRQVIVETHSDHLVRRLRGLVARAGAGSAMEKWLVRNVRIYGVEQANGESRIVRMTLTPEGGIDKEWPTDFMDEASDEENAIYYAGLMKKPLPEAGAVALVIHDDKAEP